MQAFSSCGKQGLLFTVCIAPHLQWRPCCKAWALGLSDLGNSGAQAWLAYSMWVFPDQGWNPLSTCAGTWIYIHCTTRGSLYCLPWSWHLWRHRPVISRVFLKFVFACTSSWFNLDYAFGRNPTEKNIFLVSASYKEVLKVWVSVFVILLGPWEVSSRFLP